MAVKIRLARFGTTHRPFYRVTAADGKAPRDGSNLEVLGFYDPIASKDGGKKLGLKINRVQYWLSVGAQPSDPVESLLFRAGLLEPPPLVAEGIKPGPRDTREVDPENGRVLISWFSKDKRQ